MNLFFWDGVLRGGAGSLFVLLALLFARDWRRALTFRLGVPLSIAALAYLALLPLPDVSGWWMIGLQFMTFAAPGLFWLFTSSWFDDDFRLSPWRWVVLAALILLGFGAHAGIVLDTPRGEQIVLELTGVAERLVRVVFRLLSVALVASALLTALRGWRADLVEPRRRARVALSIAIAIVITLALLATVPIEGWPDMTWRLLTAGAMLVLACAVAATMLGWRDPALLARAPKTPAASAQPARHDDSALLAQLAAEMSRERLHRQDGLTITAVAARLGVPEYRLRRAINHGLGARNFNAYLNGFRLAEARAALSDPAQRAVPILTIALDAGFGSLAPFNRAFKEREGCTPREYRAQALQRIDGEQTVEAR
jgi:AraC-like DNA-binding protein